MLYDCVLPGVPAEVLSKGMFSSCLESLRAHFADLEAGEEEITEVKFMILGNGRVGKTQICRRLRGEDYDPEQRSTHGIQITTAPLPLSLSETVTLKIWDFGGQDIYHGTHALFLKSRAIFPVVWTPNSEAQKLHIHGGFEFRNQPLGYWLAYVRRFGGADSPVLVIQSQCDRPEDEALRPPVPDETLLAFPCKSLLHYSARTDRKRATLNDAIADAVHWLRDKRGVDTIGKGRAKVKAELERMYAEGKKLITQKAYRALCKKAGNVSSPELLLDYLHNIGTVFYRRGLFDDAIILNQAWALDAVYSVFDRESKAFANIKRYGGRFRRSDLAGWVWQKHDVAEQELFLSLMKQCGICFEIRHGDRDIEAEYIAPDLLPGRNDPEIAVQLRQKWDDRSGEEETLRYELLPPGLMRSLISKIGAEAGFAAEYWRDGFYFYDEATGSRALVEQHWEPQGWAGEIRVQTQRGQSDVLLRRVLAFIDERHKMFGARPRDRAEAHGLAAKARDGDDRRAVIKPAHEPSPQPEYYVSYAWATDTPEGRGLEDEVNRLQAAALRHGVIFMRDKTAMHPGDRISEFMARIGRAPRVIIVLSDKYLRSSYCMAELFDVWRNCKGEAAEFIARTRMYVRDCAKIGTLCGRTGYLLYWREKKAEFDALVQAHGHDILAGDDLADYRRMQTFLSHLPDMLRLVQDVLRPTTVDDFISYAFDDPSNH